MKVRHRRSARISALEASRICQVGEEYTQQVKGKLMDYFEDSDSGKELSTEKRRGNKRKRKLRAVEDVAAVIPVERAVNLTHEQIVAISPEDPSSNNGSQLPLPPAIHPPAERGLFELIIEILEKKDKHKVFAQPVDPEEAEGYNEMIKVPMDFNTIQTKIHDGLYTTLDEFERDVFLIPSNAMHYNGEGTFYFKQGYAIYELAKRAFYTVRNDPRNYEVALAEIIPKPGRKPGSHSRAATNGEKSNGTNTGGARRGRPTLHGSSSLARRTHSPRHQENVSDGTEESRRNSRPWNDFISEDESIASTVYDSAKHLVNVNRDGIAYSKSLSNYSNGLGQRVQTVADRKLLAASQIAARNSLIAATASSQQCLNPQNNAINIPKSQDFYNNFPGRSTIPNPSINISSTYKVINNNPAPIIPSSQISTLSNPKSQNLLNNLSSFPTYQSLPTNFRGKSDFHGSFRGESSNQNQNQSQNSNIQMGSNALTTSVRDLNLPVNGVENHRNGLPAVDSGKLSNNNPAPDLVSRMHASKLAEYICGNNNIFEDDPTRFRAMMEANSNHVSNCIRTSGSRAAETRTITVPGPSYRVNPVPKWNQPNLGMQPLKNHGRTAPTPVYGNNVSLLGHGMEWGEHNLGSNLFGGENLIMFAPDPGTVDIAATQPVLDWNRQNPVPSSSRAVKQLMEAPGAVHGINSAQASFSSHSLSTERQEMGPPSVLYGSKSAQTSSAHHWNQPNFNSHFLGAQNQSMSLLDVSNGVDMSQGGLLPVQNPEWNQRKPFPPSIDMLGWQNQQTGINSLNQEGTFQREYPVPEVALVGALGFCSRPTYGNQTELNTLSLLDQQQPDLALQL